MLVLSVHAGFYAEFPAEIYGGSLDLFGRIAAIGLEALCDLREHTGVGPDCPAGG